ncbi:MAG: hypothetical protein KAT93_06070 [Desulfuromonadales bacterium]|nr:hypothetical protein [Desulfuromonadales bacterium]
MKKSTKIFLALSILIALSDLMLVAISGYSAKRALHDHFWQKGEQIKNGVIMNLASSGLRMQQIAMFVANDPRIQQEFLAGRRAVEEEGGGPGGPKAAESRASLLALTAQSQAELAKKFDFRQLQFHLPPGSTSFLRVHQPERFGDNMDEVRHIIVAANTEQAPKSGFETGRVSSGIRGVAPVFAIDPQTNDRVYVGALEAGTSFYSTLTTIAINQRINLAALLTLQHLEANAWPDFLKKLLAENDSIGSYLIEETTDPSIITLLNQAPVMQLLEAPGTLLHEIGQIHYAVRTFPLRDFLGERNPSRPDVGRILVWYDATSTVLDYKNTWRTNIALAVFGFLAVEILLFFGIRATTSSLENMVKAGQKEITRKNVTLKHDIEKRKQVEKEKEVLIDELQTALKDVKTLSGLLPTCAWCKKIRNDDGSWLQLEQYLTEHSDAEFSHGICNDCLAKHYPELVEKRDKGPANS